MVSQKLASSFIFNKFATIKTSASWAKGYSKAAPQPVWNYRRGEAFSERGQNLINSPIVLNYLQHIFPRGAKIFSGVRSHPALT